MTNPSWHINGMSYFPWVTKYLSFKNLNCFGNPLSDTTLMVFLLNFVINNNTKPTIK